MYNKNFATNIFHSLRTLAWLILFSVTPFSFNYAQSKASKNIRRSVTLEWQTIEGARKYELELTPVRDGELLKNRVLTFKTNKTYWDGYIAPGLFSMRLRSLDWRGVPGDWSAPDEVTIRHQKIGNFSPPHQQIMNSQNSETEEITFAWEGFPGALSFQVSIWSKDKLFNRTEETSALELKLSVPVAKEYSWSVHPIKVQGVESDPNEDVLDFSIIGKPLDKADIEKPKDEFVRNLVWEKVDFAENYEVILQRQDKQTDQWLPVFQNTQKETEIKFNEDWPGGLYRLSLVAKSTLREDGSPSQIEFKVRNGDRSADAQARFLFIQSKRHTNNWFLLASYLITEITYSATNVDLGNAPTAKLLGGTGRLGCGYLSEKVSWGFLGIVDQSGFIFENKVYNYPAFEALGVYRASIRYNNETRFSAGTYYKEVPEVLGNVRTNTFVLSQLKMFGVQAGVEHLIQIDEKFGAQANARIYLPIGGSTPNGKSVLLLPSYQVGIMGSLRLRPNAWGHAGYAYRKDVIRYESKFASDGKYNETSITGNYLNLYLEWGI